MMSAIDETEGKKGRKPWTKPVLDKITLTDQERAALLASDDPMALALKLRKERGD